MNEPYMVHMKHTLTSMNKQALKYIFSEFTQVHLALYFLDKSYLSDMI